MLNSKYQYLQLFDSVLNPYFSIKEILSTDTHIYLGWENIFPISPT